MVPFDVRVVHLQSSPRQCGVETYFYSGAVTFIVVHVFTCSCHVAAESELVSFLNGEW